MKKLQITKWGVRGLMMAAGAMLCISAAAQSYTFTEWATPTPSSQPLHIAVASGTQFYFTESAKNRIGGLNLMSQNGQNPITEWLLPPGSMPHSIVFDALGNLAFCAYSGNFVGVLTPTTSQQPPNSPFTYYVLPTAASGPIHIDTALDGVGAPEYFLSEALGNKIALLDPTDGDVYGMECADAEFDAARRQRWCWDAGVLR